MADIKTIARAKVVSTIIGQWLGKSPNLDIQKDHVRLFWPSEDLIEIQKKFDDSLSKGEKGVRVDLFPVMLPTLIKRYGIFAAGALFSAYMLGRK